MGRAEDLFNRIKSGGAAEIQNMVDTQFVEELFLDYKLAATAAPFRKLEPSDSKNFAKAIAGFANSEGGVIIWGVNCRQNPPHGDVPTATVPISNPTALKTLLDGAISGRTLPAHSGVENIAAPQGDGPAGFVVTHIPIGMHVPYRTLGDKEEYYIRAGSNFLPAPHAVLAGLFGRPPHPKLEVLVDVREPESFGFAPPGMERPEDVRLLPGETLCRLTLEVSIVNKGRGLAEDSFLSVEVPQPPDCSWVFEHSTDTWTGWRSPGVPNLRYDVISNASPPLPPGSRKRILVTKFNVRDNRNPGDVSINLICGSRNGPGDSRTITLSAEILSEWIDSYLNPSGDREVQVRNVRESLAKIREAVTS